MVCQSKNKAYVNRWNQMPYDHQPYTSLGEMPAGGSWPLFFFTRTEDGKFLDHDGNMIAFKIKTPDYFDLFWQEQAKSTIEASNNIKPIQEQQAIYWGTGVPLNQLIPILQYLINAYKLQVIEASRLYYIIGLGLNDATIICWHFKYQYQIPRPEQYCPNFKPFLATPQHPSYPAGHSVIPGCFFRLLAHFFPCESEELYRIFEECSYSRLYGGVHYPLDISEGNKLGIDIADKIIESLGKQSDWHGAWVDRVYTEKKEVNLRENGYNQVFYNA